MMHSVLWLLIRCVPVSALLLSVWSPCTAQERIVSLAPSLTEIVCELGLCEQLVGVTEYCSWPPPVRNLPRVGSYLEPNLEVILAMRPDLVLALPEHKSAVEKLKALNLNVATIRNYSLEDIYQSVARVGALIDRIPQSTNWVRDTKLQVQQLTRSPQQRPRCLLVLGHEAGQDSIREVYVVGRKGFLNELLVLAGGENAYPEDQPHFPNISQEVLLSLNPDIIVELVPSEVLTEQQKQSLRKRWQAVPHLDAVRNGRYYILNSAHLLQAGPRFLETLRALSELAGQP